MVASESSVSLPNQVKLGTNDVLVGMFVCELDCKWSETPFPLGGFHVKTADEIVLLQKFCKVVTIDTNKGAEPARRRRSNLTILSSARRAAPAAASLKVNRDAWPVTHTLKQQIDKSHASYLAMNDALAGLAQAVRKGDPLDLDSLQEPSTALIDSILANPQTLVWILNTEDQLKQQNSHCVRAAIWAALLSRQFGLKRNDIELLFQGVLLADIGMNLLPERLVNKQGPFRKKEYLAYRKHVDFGLELLAGYPQLDERVVRIVRNHHERHDGLGFPKGLKGDQIPVLARFTSLAYCYERLLKSNCRNKRLSPARAISRLYKQRELKFPEQLVVEFIHVLGTYPVGSVVQLSNGELALVLEQNMEERLSPKVAVIADAQQQVYENPKPIDLSSPKEERRIKASVNPGGLAISLENYTFQFVGKRISFAGLGFRY